MAGLEKPLGVAVIGLNFGGYVVRVTCENKRYKCLFACDISEERARTIGEQFNVPWTTSFEEVLSSPEVEAVFIYTPPHMHGEHICMAARAGKSIRVTKPLERSSRAAIEALNYAKEQGVAVAVDSPPPRYNGIYAIAKELIDNGELGDIISASNYTGSFYGNIYPDGTWYDNPDLCPGGPIYRLGIYGINYFNVILGKPRQVTAVQSWKRSTRPTPDTGSVTIVYENGAVVTITNSLSWGGVSYPDTTLIHGTKGSLLINPRHELHRTPAWEIFFRVRDNVRNIPIPQNPGGMSDEDYFIDMVRNHRQPEIPLSHAVEGVRVIEAAHLSLKENRAVLLDETCSR